MRTPHALLLALVLLALAPAVSAMESEECLACHSDSTLTKEDGARSVSMHVDPDRFAASVHGVLSCSDCHGDVTDYPHDPVPAKVACETCHPDSVAAYDRSVHAGAATKGNGHAPVCAACHGSAHQILPSSDPASLTAHQNVPQTCGTCHGQKFVMEASGFSIEPYLNYQESVHGKALASGEQRAAVCTDCHDSHAITTPRAADSPINKFNIPDTCGTCHAEVAEQFRQSVHGQALERGSTLSPSCTDCHGIHNIKAHSDPTSSVSFQAVARSTCAQCHSGVRLTQERGVSGRRVQTYAESYHGLATRLGSTVAANCASCHGVHNILPSTDPDSLIHPARLPETCGSCHPGATDSFVRTKVHMDVPAREDLGTTLVYWIRKLYLWMIGLVIGGMLLHNLVIWIRKVRAAKRRPGRVIVRMTRNERMQHMLNLLAFFALVLSGFALAYPESWLATLMGSSEQVRRWTHRVAAIVMMAVGVWHVGYMLGTSAGRKGLLALMPRWKDVSDLRQMLLWMLGRSDRRPQFDRFGYIEKSEYWALVWGTVVMSATGLMLWAKVAVGSLVPGWWIDVALAIHFWEAVLATLAILVWHMYHVIFDPDVYPMNFAWLDGRMSPESYRHEHPLDYARWLAAQERAGEPDDETTDETDPTNV